MQELNENARRHNELIERIHPKRRPFTKEEDIRLIKLEKMYRDVNEDKKWEIIAGLMTNRTPRKCRERFKFYLNLNIMGTGWTKKEDILLLTKVNRIGKRWTNVSCFFPNRTPKQLKNRYNSKEFKNNISVFPENGNYTEIQKFMVEKANETFSTQRTPVTSLDNKTKENLLSFWENNPNIFGEDNYDDVFNDTGARRKYTEKEEDLLVSLRNGNDNMTFASIDRVTARQYSDFKFRNMKKANMKIQKEIDSSKGEVIDFE